MPLSRKAVDYIDKLVSEPRDYISRPIERGKKKYPAYEQDVLGVADDELAPPSTEDMFGQVLGDRLVNIQEFKKDFLAIFDIIVPQSSFQISSTDIERLLVVFSSFLMGMDPEDFRGSVQEVYEFFKSMAATRGDSPDPSVEVFREMGNRNGFERMVGYIEDADTELFERVRKTIRGSADWLHTLRHVRSEEEKRQRKMSTRRLARQGPWKNPSVATRALMVGVGVGSVGFINSIGQDGAKILRLVT